MTGERDRIKRAGNYVLGLMDDEERERAERDLEIDPAFRDAVLQLAERAHVFDLGDTATGNADESWKHVLQRLSQLPQMRSVTGAPAAVTKPVIQNPGQDTYARNPQPPADSRRGLIIALGLAIMFALGYLAQGSGLIARCRPWLPWLLLGSVLAYALYLGRLAKGDAAVALAGACVSLWLSIACWLLAQQLLERRQSKLDNREQREAVRNMLREKRLDEAFVQWAEEVRGRAYVEFRDPPT